MGLGHRININSIQVVGTPTALNQRNQFDELGDLMSLQRFPGEKNDSFKRRLSDSYVHIANSSYKGLIYGITRELGLTLYSPLVINPRVDNSGNFLAADPLIKFDGALIYLYSDYSNGQLDWIIDRYQTGGNYEHLGSLVELINTTVYFEATLEPNIDSYTRSMSILNQSNIETIPAELITMSQHFSLKNKRAIQGTVLFSDLETFYSEVSSPFEVSRPGQYCIDYLNSIVTTWSPPVTGTRVKYSYYKYPFKPIASPIILNDISNDNFRTKLFQQILQDDGNYSPGLCEELGTDILNELYSIYSLTWGA